MERENRKQAVVPILCIVLGLAFACILFAKIIVVKYTLPGRDPDGNFITSTHVAVYSFYMLLCEQSNLYTVFYSIFAVFVLTGCFGIFGVIVHYDRLEKFEKFVYIGSNVLLIASCIVAFGCYIMSHYLTPTF